MNETRFARRVFLGAGIYGLLALLPMYGLETTLGALYPPPVTHPEFYYGFAGVAAAWQIVFLLIGRDPVRLRPVMIPAVLEKLGFGIPAVVLVALGRTAPPVLGPAIIDLVLGLLFAVAYRRTRRPAAGFRP